MSKEQSYFEKQRDEYLGAISTNMEEVLNNLNLLNRSLEGVIEVGKEFENVGALWSNFYEGLSNNNTINNDNDKDNNNDKANKIKSED